MSFIGILLDEIKRIVHRSNHSTLTYNNELLELTQRGSFVLLICSLTAPLHAN
jgi:hypothetical protein